MACSISLSSARDVFSHVYYLENLKTFIASITTTVIEFIRAVDRLLPVSDSLLIL